VTTTDTLFALKVQRKVQWCCWIGRSGIILWIGTKSRQVLPSERLINTRARIPAEILARGLSCVSPTSQLTRE
jgi:hypothetical protein